MIKYVIKRLGSGVVKELTLEEMKKFGYGDIEELIRFELPESVYEVDVFVNDQKVETKFVVNAEKQWI